MDRRILYVQYQPDQSWPVNKRGATNETLDVTESELEGIMAALVTLFGPDWGKHFRYKLGERKKWMTTMPVKDLGEHGDYVFRARNANFLYEDEDFISGWDRAMGWFGENPDDYLYREPTESILEPSSTSPSSPTKRSKSRNRPARQEEQIVPGVSGETSEWTPIFTGLIPLRSENVGRTEELHAPVSYPQTPPSLSHVEAVSPFHRLFNETRTPPPQTTYQSRFSRPPATSAGRTSITIPSLPSSFSYEQPLLSSEPKIAAPKTVEAPISPRTKSRLQVTQKVSEAGLEQQSQATEPLTTKRPTRPQPPMPITTRPSRRTGRDETTAEVHTLAQFKEELEPTEGQVVKITGRQQTGSRGKSRLPRRELPTARSQTKDLCSLFKDKTDLREITDLMNRGKEWVEAAYQCVTSLTSDGGKPIRRRWEDVKNFRALDTIDNGYIIVKREEKRKIDEILSRSWKTLKLHMEPRVFSRNFNTLISYFSDSKSKQLAELVIFRGNIDDEMMVLSYISGVLALNIEFDFYGDICDITENINPQRYEDCVARETVEQYKLLEKIPVTDLILDGGQDPRLSDVLYALPIESYVIHSIEALTRLPRAIVVNRGNSDTLKDVYLRIELPEGELLDIVRDSGYEVDGDGLLFYVIPGEAENYEREIVEAFPGAEVAESDRLL